MNKKHKKILLIVVVTTLILILASLISIHIYKEKNRVIFSELPQIVQTVQKTGYEVEK